VQILAQNLNMLVPTANPNPAQDHVRISQNHRSSYFTFQFFKKKLYLKSIYIFGKSCSSCYTEHNKIEFAIFGFFCDLLWILQGAAETLKRGRNLFASRPLERSKVSQPYPWVASRPLEVPGTLQCGPWAKGAARSPGIRRPRRRSWPGKRLGRV
jgi:hypothetical protein